LIYIYGLKLLKRVQKIFIQRKNYEIFTLTFTVTMRHSGLRHAAADPRMPPSDLAQNLDRPGDLDGLPRRVDRRAAAAILSQHFPIKPRTLERWPLPWQTLNGKAVVETTALIAEAERRVKAAPTIRGGRYGER
jgi:hypothetical protein